jgi:hypothetical protein
MPPARDRFILQTDLKNDPSPSTAPEPSETPASPGENAQAAVTESLLPVPEMASSVRHSAIFAPSGGFSASRGAI